MLGIELFCGYFSVSFQSFVLRHLVITPVRNTKTLRLPIRPLDVVSDANVSQFIRAGNKRREYSYLFHKLGAFEKSEFLSEFDLVVSKNVGWLL